VNAALTCQQCGRAIEPKRPHARFCSDRCRAIDWRESNGEDAGERVQEHPLREVREEQEATDLKSKLSQIIYQGIVDRLKYGSVHADDLEPLFPNEVRDICRKLVGAQFGSLASRGYIVESERRKSKVRSRKGAKSGVFIFTTKGREKLAQSPATNREGSAAEIAGTLDRPEADSLRRSTSSGARQECVAGSEEASEAGRGHSASASDASSELLELPIEPERPRSAWTDPEIGEAA